MKILTLLIIFSSILYSNQSIAEKFNVALAILTPFNPISNEINSANYIGLHLYHPLFNLDEDGQSDSKFLDMHSTKSLSKEFNEYRLCLKKNITFSDNSVIHSEDMKASLSYMSELYPHLLEILTIRTEDPLCIYMKLKRSVPNLFKKLTGIASTVLKKNEVNKPYPIGFGPYKISHRNDNHLFLISEDKNIRFNEVEFRKINSKIDLNSEKFQDLNQMPVIDENINQNDQSNIYSLPSLKVYSFVINLPDEKMRHCIQNVLKTGKWTTAYNLNLIPQKSFLPWIKNHTNWSFNEEKCSFPKFKIKFLVADAYNSNSIKSELIKIGSDKIFSVVSLTGANFAKFAFSGKPYIALMSFDSSSSTASLDGDFSLYFESFFIKENRIVTKPIPNLKELIQEATLFDNSLLDREIKTRIAEKLLLESSWVLPVGRLNRNYTFPNNIKIEKWADKLNGIPAIWKIK